MENLVIANGHSRTYWREPSRIYYTEKSMGSTVTHTVIQADPEVIAEVWHELTSLYMYGKLAKANEIKAALGVYN